MMVEQIILPPWMNNFDALSFIMSDPNLESAVHDFYIKNPRISEAKRRLIITYSLLLSTTQEHPWISATEFNDNCKNSQKLSEKKLIENISSELKEKGYLKRAGEIADNLKFLIGTSNYKRINKILEEDKKKEEKKAKKEKGRKYKLVVSSDAIDFISSLGGEDYYKSLSPMLQDMKNTFKHTKISQDNLTCLQKMFATYVYFLLDKDREKLIESPSLTKGLFEMLAEVEKKSAGSSVGYMKVIVEAGTPLDEDEVTAFDIDVINQHKADDQKRIDKNEIKNPNKIIPYARLEFLIAAAPSLIWNSFGDLEHFKFMIFGGTYEKQDIHYIIPEDLTTQYDSINEKYGINVTEFVIALKYVNGWIAQYGTGSFETDFNDAIESYGIENRGYAEGSDELEDWRIDWADVRDYFMDNAPEGMDCNVFLDNTVQKMSFEETHQFSVSGITGAGDTILEDYKDDERLVRALKLFYGTSVPYIANLAVYTRSAELGISQMFKVNDLFLNMNIDEIKAFIKKDKFYMPFGENNLQFTWDGYLVLRVEERFRRMFYIRTVGAPEILIEPKQVYDMRLPYSTGRIFIPQFGETQVRSVQILSSGRTSVEVEETDEQGRSVYKTYEADIDYEQVPIAPEESLFANIDSIMVVIQKPDGDYKQVKITYARPRRERRPLDYDLRRGRGGARLDFRKQKRVDYETTRTFGDVDISGKVVEVSADEEGVHRETGNNIFYMDLSYSSSEYKFGTTDTQRASVTERWAAREINLVRPRPFPSGLSEDASLFKQLINTPAHIRRIYFTGTLEKSFENDLRMYEGMNAWAQLVLMHGCVLAWRKIYNQKYSRTDLLLNPRIGRPIFGEIVQSGGFGWSSWFVNGEVYKRSPSRAHLQLQIPNRAWAAGGRYAETPGISETSPYVRGERFGIVGGRFDIGQLGIKLPYIGRLSTMESYMAYGDKRTKIDVIKGKETPFSTPVLVVSDFLVLLA